MNEPYSATIDRFLTYATKQLKPFGVRVSVDVFGLAATNSLGIGQSPKKMARIVDAIYPMVYPSHFGPGQYGLPDPQAVPGTTVGYALSDFTAQMRGTKCRSRRLAAGLLDGATVHARGCSGRSAGRSQEPRPRLPALECDGHLHARSPPARRRRRVRLIAGASSAGPECARRDDAALTRTRPGAAPVSSRQMKSSRAIQLLTEIPGPRSREILARKKEFVAAPVTVQAPTVIDFALGAVVTDVDGNRFLDFAGGIGCLVVGHSHPKVVEAVREQAGRFLHTDFAVVPYESYVTLAGRLIAAAPFRIRPERPSSTPAPRRSRTRSSSLRLATKRPAVIAFEGGFHGRTLLALTMTSKANPYKAGLGPLAPAVYHLPFAQDYRGPSARRGTAPSSSVRS